MDLKTIEERLNSDERFRADFLADPVNTLEGAGVTLPPRARATLPRIVAEAQAARTPVPGSTLHGQGNDHEISISISKDF